MLALSESCFGPYAVPSLHITLGVETDTDEWTWLALLTEAAEALHVAGAKDQLQATRSAAALPDAACNAVPL